MTRKRVTASEKKQRHEWAVLMPKTHCVST